ncbi:MAG: hypothetical protein JSS87_01045 [Acidobacteria bacterium]|nr:hypothetical protein [Acidobacteriota bacterium]
MNNHYIVNFRHKRLAQAMLIGCCLLALPAVLCASNKPQAFPLRVQIKSKQGHTSLSQGLSNGSIGTGRGNLFENSSGQGFDYSYSCGEPIKTTPGYETYMARWRKRDQVLTLLVPELGKENKYWTCDLKVQMRPYFYGADYREVPREEIKTWMEKHNYDPEHGKNMPTGIKRNDPGDKDE